MGLGRELLDIAGGILRVTFAVYVPLIVVLVLWHYPYDTDQPAHDEDTAGNSAAFYEAVYSGPDSNGVARRRGLNYEETARKAAADIQLPQRVGDFISRYGLTNGKVLEVGSGQGSLQDVVADYTGLDISNAAAAKYHKKFVVASATQMPFPDNTFDGIFTVWVMEHIPEPEKALREMRRVLKPGGKLYLHVAWNCEPWFADGFAVRPYSDFTLPGKAVKASLLLRDTGYFKAFYGLPLRSIRWAQYAVRGKEEPLRFRNLRANYTTYWQADSDAAISLDSFETLLWHQAQGDKCLNCASNWNAMGHPEPAWIFEIHK